MERSGVQNPADGKASHEEDFLGYSYQVLEILKDETDAKPVIGAKIEVVPAHDRMMLNLNRRYHLEGVHKSPILEFYNESAAQIG